MPKRSQATRVAISDLNSQVAIYGLAVVCALPLAVRGQQAAADEVDYARDVAPLLRKNCVACHNKAEAEAGLNLESHTELMKGGDSGAAVVVGDASAGELLARIIDDDDPMPPEDNSVGAKRLTEAEVNVLRRWIEAGAKASKKMKEQAIQWRTLPESVRPIYALHSSQDGQHFVYGRGNSVVTESPLGGDSDPQLLVDPELADRRAHRDIVQSVAISPDSEWLVSGGYRTIKFWQQPIREKVVLSGLPTDATQVAFSPLGDWVAFTTGGHALEIVNVDVGRVVRLLKIHSDPITCVAWNASGSSVTSSDSSGRIVVTEVQSFSSQEKTLDEKLVFEQLIHFADATWFGRTDVGQLYRVELDGKELVTTRLGDESGVADMQLLNGESPRLVVAWQSGVISMHDAASGNELSRFDTENRIEQLAVAEQAAKIVTVAQNGSSRLWSLAGESIAGLDEDYVESRRRYETQRQTKRKTALVASLESQLPVLKTASEKEEEALTKVQQTRDMAAKELETAGAEVVAATKGVEESNAALAAAKAELEAAMKKIEAAEKAVAEKQKAADAAKAKKVAAAEQLTRRDQALVAAKKSVESATQRIEQLTKRIESSVVELEAAKGEFAAAEQASKLPAPVAQVVFASRDHIALVCNDNVVRLMDAESGRPVRNFTTDALQSVSNYGVSNQGILGGAGGFVAYSSVGELKRFELSKTWELGGTIGSVEASPLSDRVTALDFSPDGKLLAVGSGPPSRFGELKIFDAATRELVRDFGEVHSDTILCVKFSPDGKYIVTSAADKLCRLFDVATGQMLRAFEGHTHHVLAVAWRDHGMSVATASADNTIKTWKVETGEQIRTISGLKKEVTALSFVGDSNQLASASSDGVVRLYNADDGKLVRTFSGASNALYTLSVSADLLRITAGGQTGQLWTWTIADGKLVER